MTIPAQTHGTRPTTVPAPYKPPPPPATNGQVADAAGIIVGGNDHTTGQSA